MESEAAAASDAYDELYVSPTCFIQTAESRFGPDVLDDLKNFVAEVPHEADLGFEEEDSEAEEEEEEEPPEEFTWAELYEMDAGFVGFETDPNHAQHGFPRIAATRNNLTALSQRYNLYFAAYQDRIYVYQPRRAGPQILPSPSLILHPRQSKLGEQCGGAIDPRFPHQINHIIVGNLGDLEIVLLAYDDGDTVAYYTHAIIRGLKTTSGQARGPGASPSRQGAHPKPFFHENVGKSAWGLAIHEQSRLIAVSSNLHEVTVFAFAIRRAGITHNLFATDDSPRLECGRTAFELQRHFQSRTRTWRIILPIGRGGNNIPNVSFMDDEQGNADKVVAIDIGGSAWLLDIWNIGTPPIRWPDAFAREPQMLHGARGWGVLVLPYSCFQPTKTIREALGVPAGEVIAATKPEAANRVWLDTTCSLYYIKGYSTNAELLFRQRHTRHDYARMHAAKVECQEDDLSDLWVSESDSEDDEGVDVADPLAPAEAKSIYPSAASQQADRWSTITPGPPSGKLDPTCSFDDIYDRTQLSRSIIPIFGETPQLGDNLPRHAHFNRLYAERQRKTKHVEFAKAELPEHLIKDYCLFRTSPTDVELQPFDRDAPCVEIRYLITYHNHTTTPTWDLHPAYSERLSMLLHVPELSLVVAGSPTGRVALITLTKTAKRLHMARVRHGFRVDCVLPRKEEDDKKIRPVCPLIGVAISPVPSRPGRGLELRPGAEAAGGGGPAAPPPVVYRLMLHYKDHTILMYDVARGGEKEALLIF